MKIDHITLGGSTLLRDTKDILPQTVSLLKNAGFQVNNTSVELPFPQTEFMVKITSEGSISIFDIKKNNEIAYSNICCLSKESKTGAMEFVHTMRRNNPLFRESIVIDPKTDLFIYTVPVIPFLLSPEEMQIAGEIELYIFYSLYLAK